MAIAIHAKVSVEIFPKRIEQLTDSHNGPVGRMVEHAAQVVLVGARARVGDRYSGQHPGPRIKDTGKVVPIGGAAFAVVFDHPIAFLHHEGKRSGYQIPKSGTSYILSNKFDPSRSQGGRFRARGPVIWQGSTSGNPFIRDAAAAVGLRASGSLLRGNRPTSLFRLRQP